MSVDGEHIRVDKWLWYARFFKTRTICAKLINDGRVSVNDQRIRKPAMQLSVGDVLTFNQGEWARKVRVEHLGTRRGPAPEAQTLYFDMSAPPPERKTRTQNPKFDGKGRPTGKQRRAWASFSSKNLE